jgi:hypothetical protein
VADGVAEVGLSEPVPEAEEPQPQPQPQPEPEPEPEPEPVCEYCHQTVARCAEIKETRLDSWRALHYDDPAEVLRRREDAEDQRLAQLLGHPTARMIENAAAREPEETEEEATAREIRKRLGWETESGIGTRRG